MIRDFLAHISRNDPSIEPIFRRIRSEAHNAHIQDLMSYSFEVLCQLRKHHLEKAVLDEYVLTPLQTILENFQPNILDIQLLTLRKKRIIIRFFAALEELLWNRAPEAFTILSTAGSTAYQSIYTDYLSALRDRSGLITPLPQSGRTTRERMLGIFAPSNAAIRQKFQEFLRWAVLSAKLGRLQQMLRLGQHVGLDNLKDELETLVKQGELTRSEYIRINNLVRVSAHLTDVLRRDMETRLYNIGRQLNAMRTVLDGICNEYDAMKNKLDTGAIIDNLDSFETIIRSRASAVQENVIQAMSELDALKGELNVIRRAHGLEEVT